MHAHFIAFITVSNGAFMFFLIFENSVLGVLGVCEHHPFVYIYMSVAHPILLRQSHLCVCVNRTVVRIGRKNIHRDKKSQAEQLLCFIHTTLHTTLQIAIQ